MWNVSGSGRPTGWTGPLALALLITPLSGCMVKINRMSPGAASPGSSTPAVSFQQQATSFTVTTSAAATVSGTPRIALTVGSTTRYATYSSGSGTSALTFVYTPLAGDYDDDGVTIATTIDLNGGTILGAGGADLSGTVKISAPAATLLVDAVPHTLSIQDSNGASSLSVTEGSGNRALVVSLSPAALGDVTLPIRRTGTATAGSDDDLSITSVKVPAGSTSVSVPFSVFGNSMVQSDRELVLNLQRPSIGEHFKFASNGDQIQVLIRDDDPGLVSLSQISSGANHTCGIVSGSGVLKCWGANSDGQLGDATNTDRSAPTTIDAGTSYSMVAAGGYYTCGITTGGALKCWGRNNYSQVGDGTTTYRNAPVTLTAGTSYSWVTAGATHACAIVVSTGELRCWGYNGNGQLGDGTTATRNTPTTINSGTAYATVSAGGVNTCGILGTGNVLKCWGYNADGEVGDGTTTQRTSPVTADPGTAYSSVSVGSMFACGIVASTGVLKCWGSNNNGQLGDGTTITRYSPVVIDSGSTYSRIAAGGNQTCGVLSGGASGSLKCWGYNSNGQLGDGTLTSRSSPFTPDPANTFAEVSVGTQHACGITTAGSLRCWGDRGNGRLGAASTSLSPAVVDSAGKYRSVALGIFAACAIETQSGNLKCWGSNSYGNVGDGTTTNRQSPVSIDIGTSYNAITLGNRATCGLSGSTGVRKCWGDPNSQEFGNGTTTQSTTPLAVEAGVFYSSIASGLSHVCGIRSGTGALYCWGDNTFGQIGDGTTVPRGTPVLIDPGTAYSKVSAGGMHTCGIVSSSGALKCWGFNGFNQLGDGTATQRLSPVLIDAGTPYSEISAGQTYSTCGITGAGVLKCWGFNSSYQLGDGTTTQRSTPVVINAGTAYSKVSMGNGSACAIVASSGALHCWGDNQWGQLGSGDTTARTTPGVTDAGSAYSWIATSQSFACGVLTDGALKCWGTNSNGELGLGTYTSMRPASIPLK